VTLEAIGEINLDLRVGKARFGKPLGELLT
jgi:hypothetical protein